MGILFALYILCGRWSIARLFPDPSIAFYFEVRFWLLLGFAISLFVPLVSCEALSLEEKKIKSGSIYTFISLFIFLIYLLLSTLWAPDLDLALWKFYEIFILLVAQVALFRSILGSGREIFVVTFWGTVIITGIMLVSLALMQISTDNLTRLSVLAGGPNVFGRSMSFLSLSGLFLMRRYGWSLLGIGLTIISFLLALLSGSRGALVALVGAFAIFAFIERMNIKKLLKLTTIATCVFILFVLGTPLGTLALATYENRFVGRVLNEFYWSGRDDIYNAAYALGMEHPLLGAGLAAFPATGIHVYPHNFFLEVFSEGGIIGILLVALIVTVATLSLWPLRTTLDGAMVSGLGLICVASQFSGDLYDSRGIFTFLLLCFFVKKTSQPNSTRVNGLLTEKTYGKVLVKAS